MRIASSLTLTALLFACNSSALLAKELDSGGPTVNANACPGDNCIPLDMSKKTCSVVMPMIKAISCSNFSGESAALCNAAKPYLMTDADCNNAESWAAGEAKGPNAEACKNQTFGVGTGSWSYILACSNASAVVADHDGKENPPTVVTNPECINELKGLGVEFQTLGTVSTGSFNGTSCYVQNAVSLRGTAIPFGANLTMTCEMALAMEKFGQQLKPFGVSSYYNVGSIRHCGPMRDKGGNKKGTITEHSLGRAVDFSGVVIGGKKISMAAFVNKPNSPEGGITAAIKSLACSVFRGVLSPSYEGYVDVMTHFHVEWGKANKMCK